MRIVPASLRESTMPVVLQRRALGVNALDAVLGGGLAGGVHEVYAAETGDGPAAAGFGVALTTILTTTGSRVIWLRMQHGTRRTGVVQANGWAELGGMPGLGFIGVVDNALSLLRAAVDALRCAALGAVVVEGWGAMRELDLTASRRLALAAEKSGVPLLLLRADATPVPSAAQTRWQVAAAPSRALPGNAPGLPTFDVTLLRQRSGLCGLSWRLEWDRDQRMFREAAPSGAVVSPVVHRPAAHPGRSDRQAA